MKHLKAPLFLVWLLCSGVPSTKADPDLELKLLHDKPVYLIGEPIWIDILVMNHGMDTVVVPYPGSSLGLQKFVVINNGIDTLPYRGGIATLMEIPEYSLPPGDTLYGLFNLLDGYRYSKSSSSFYKKLLQGEVTVSSYFYGLVTSNTISFTIVEPSGAESEAYTLLNEGSRYQYITMSKAKLEELLERFPNSVYGQLACVCLSGSHDPEQNRKYARMLIERFPQSGYIRSCLSFGYLGEKKDPGWDARLDSLMLPDKPFRLRMYARGIRNGVQVH
jgi:hypothetical protein